MRRFADLLEQVMGLHAASIGMAGVERAVAERMRALRITDADAYWQTLSHTPAEMQALIETVVVPETWFFRDPAAFAALAREAVARAGRAEPLRLLSLPCSTGEEPYTMAMALIEAGLPASRFRIDAIDISARALDVARRGLYGRNSFRGADLAFRDRHFRPVGRDWRLNDIVRVPVHLARGNVLEDGFLAGGEQYDVIFCRNLLIYFDVPTQRRVVGVLGRLLRPDGVLFAGHSESGVMSAHGFASAQIPMAFAFRHAPARPVAAVPVKPAPVRLAAVKSATPARWAVPPYPLPKLLRPVPATPTLKDLWHLVNGGRLEEADRACETYLLAQGTCVDGLLLRGLIHDARGDGAAAASAYRKVLYLDPNHAEALDHLALLMRKQGDDSGARLLANRMRRQSGGGLS